MHWILDAPGILVSTGMMRQMFRAGDRVQQEEEGPVSPFLGGSESTVDVRKVYVAHAFYDHSLSDNGHVASAPTSILPNSTRRYGLMKFPSRPAALPYKVQLGQQRWALRPPPPPPPCVQPARDFEQKPML
jgi:hypothetical protein